MNDAQGTNRNKFERLRSAAWTACSAVFCSAAVMSACAPTPALPSEQDLLGAVPLIVTDKLDGTLGYGGGVVMSDEGDIVTSAHVVGNVSRVRVLFYNPTRVLPAATSDASALSLFVQTHAQEFVEAGILRDDSELDLALLTVARDTSAYHKLHLRTDRISPLSRVFTVGHPLQNVWSLSSGVVGLLRDGYLQSDAQVMPGSSGGPLVDEAGGVVGIVSWRATARGQTFARSARDVSAFYRRSLL